MQRYNYKYIDYYIALLAWEFQLQCQITKWLCSWHVQQDITVFSYLVRLNITYCLLTVLVDSGDQQSSGQKLRKGVRIYLQWYLCTLCDDFSLKENGEQVDCNFKLWRYSQVGSDSIFEISTTCDYRRESLWTYKTYCNLEIKEGMGHSCLSGGLNDLSCYIFKLAISLL